MYFVRFAAACMAYWLLTTGAQAFDKESARLFEFHGQILGDNQKTIRNPEPVVFLHGATLPYSSHSRVGLDGKFKFQKLLAGSYVLVVDVPGGGEMRQTVEIGPSFADKKGRIREVVRFVGSVSTENLGLVHAAQLRIPKQAKTELDRALRELSRNNVESSRAHLAEALRLAPEYAEAHNQLGVIAYQTGQFAEAEEHFRRALKEAPTAFWALVNLGGALLALGKDKESLEINQEAVRRAPEDALAHSQLGKSYLRTGDLEKAEIHLRQAKALDPRHFSAPQLVLADLYYMQGRREERIRELEEYLKFHPDGDFAPQVRILLDRARSAASPR